MPSSFAPITTEARNPAFAPTFLIAALDAARREAAQAPPEAAPDPFTGALAEARRVAFQEGHAAGLQEGEARTAAQAAQAAAIALDALRAGHAAAAAAVRAAAEDVARVALAMLDAALPGLAADNAGALAAAFAQRLQPMLEGAPEARLRVAPGLAGETRALLGASTIIVEEDPGLPPGDARAEWRSGGAALDLAARRREIRAVLDAAGLGTRE